MSVSLHFSLIPSLIIYKARSRYIYNPHEKPESQTKRKNSEKENSRCHIKSGNLEAGKKLPNQRGEKCDNLNRIITHKKGTASRTSEISFITTIIATMAIIDKAIKTTQVGKIAHNVINIACNVYII